MNFMDFSDDACLLIFTHGQKKKMRGLFARNGARNSLLESKVCDSNAVTNNAPLPEPQKKATVKIFPNPVADVLNIKIENGSNEETTVEIYSVHGRKVMSTTVQQQANINLKTLTPGIYFVKTGSGNDFETIKLVKQ